MSAPVSTPEIIYWIKVQVSIHSPTSQGLTQKVNPKLIRFCLGFFYYALNGDIFFVQEQNEWYTCYVMLKIICIICPLLQIRKLVFDVPGRLRCAANISGQVFLNVSFISASLPVYQVSSSPSRLPEEIIMPSSHHCFMSFS